MLGVGWGGWGGRGLLVEEDGGEAKLRLCVLDEVEADWFDDESAVCLCCLSEWLGRTNVTSLCLLFS